MAKKRKSQKKQQEKQPQPEKQVVQPQEKPSKQSRHEKMQAQARKKQLTNWAIIGLIGAIALGWAIFRPKPVVIEEALSQRPSIGSETAQVVLREYGDYHCHGCEGWHEAGIIEEIMAQFGEGEIRYEFSHFPQFAPPLAAAAECANDQDHFWEFHDVLFENFPAQMDDLNTYAADIGMDVATFETCVDSGKYDGTVREMLNYARTSGFRGTPSFQVNGENVPSDPTAIVNALRAELSNAN